MQQRALVKLPSYVLSRELFVLSSSFPKKCTTLMVNLTDSGRPAIFRDILASYFGSRWLLDSILIEIWDGFEDKH